MDSPTDTSYFHLTDQEKENSTSFDEKIEPGSPNNNGLPRAMNSLILRNSMTNGFIEENNRAIARSKSATVEFSEAHDEYMEDHELSQSPSPSSTSSASPRSHNSINQHHKRGKSYDFVGFTFKPNSWIDVGENKYLEI